MLKSTDCYNDILNYIDAIQHPLGDGDILV